MEGRIVAESSPQERIAELLTGFWYNQVVYAAAKLGRADLLHAGPRNANELAASTGMHAPSLYRLLRALASLGLFTEDDQGCFTLMPMGDCLRSDVPGSMRALA